MIYLSILFSAAFTLNQEQNLTFVKTDFQVSKFKTFIAFVLIITCCHFNATSRKWCKIALCHVAFQIYPLIKNGFSWRPKRPQ